MSITYSSAFLEQQVNSISELAKYIPSSKVKLVLDTNICIIIREFYQRPNKLSEDSWNFLKQFIQEVHSNNILIDYSLGCEEACRSNDKFQINEKKLIQMSSHLKQVFNMSYEQFLLYRESEVDIAPIKDETQKHDTKLEALNEPSSFQNIMLINYAGLLKSFLIQKFDYDDNLSKLLRFYSFLDNEVDVIGPNLMFGIYLFGGDTNIRKLLFKKYKDEEQLLHNILNAAIDLSFLTLVTNRYEVGKYIPVFATRDIGLGVMFRTMKLRFAITDEHELSKLPQLVQGTYPTHIWKDKEINKIDEYITDLRSRRLNKSLEIDNSKKANVLNNLLLLCGRLEKQIKEKIKN